MLHILVQALLLQKLSAGGPNASSASGPLLACGTTGAAGADSKEVLDAFAFVTGVCSQVGDKIFLNSDSATILPSTCTAQACQRAVQLVADSCILAFAKDSFLRTAFKSQLDPLIKVSFTGLAQIARLDGPVL